MKPQFHRRRQGRQPAATESGHDRHPDPAVRPIIAYLEVVPAHRGHGYIRDVLAVGTSLLAAQNLPRIRAATDVGNVPMAAAFALAGYVHLSSARST
jgi:RimJ/RimL family protein N-acetyltransferase